LDIFAGDADMMRAAGMIVQDMVNWHRQFAAT